MISRALMRLGPWRLPGALGFCSAALLAGCQRDNIRVYQVPKAKPAVDMAAHGQAPRARPRVDYQLPAGWQEKPAESISIASFSVTGEDGQTADVGIVPFPGMLGNDSLALNIWRERVQLPPLTESELAAQGETVAIGPDQGRLFDMVSTDLLLGGRHRVRLLLALMKRESTSWFFKMSGEDALVQSQKAVFIDFLKSISIQESSPALAGPPPRFTANESRVRGNEGLGRRPAWKVPSDWQEQSPTQMVLAKFLVSGQSGAKADVTVSVFPGDTGGLLANVNRWRGQVGLAPVDQAACNELLSALDVAGGKAMLVDMTGKDDRGQPKRLIGVIVPRNEETWFYKMLGDSAVAEHARPAFVQFVQSAQYAQAVP